VAIKKQIGMVGLGKMGGNIALQLAEKKWDVFAFNRTARTTKGFEKEGIVGRFSLSELMGSLEAPRVIWMMLPAGKPVEDTIFKEGGLLDLMDEGDMLIDAGNSFYMDSVERAARIVGRGIKFVDVGVSGGPGGARNGACLMVGGQKESFEYIEPLYKEISVIDGFQFFEGYGAGHFVKMVHNGIEYGMMQAIAEGFNVLRESDYNIDLIKATDVYGHGSVIASALISWLKEGYEKIGPDLEDASGTVGFTGEGEWTVSIAKEMGLKTENIEQAFNFRVNSKDNPDYVGKVLTVLRDQFGGHGL